MSSVNSMLKGGDLSASAVIVTAICLSNEYLFIGTSEGELKMFNLKTDELYQTFVEGSREFMSNPVTLIDVHPLYQHFVLVSYARNQLVLLDTRDIKKPLKIMTKIEHLQNGHCVGYGTTQK